MLRDIAGDAATNAAGKVKPSEDQLEQMDRPADDNTWHEKPDLSKDNLRAQAKKVYGGDPKKDAQDVAEAGLDAADRPTGKEVTTPDPTSQKNFDTVAGQHAAKTVLDQKVNSKVSPETKEKIKQRNEEYKRRAREYFNKKMPTERKDQTIWRLKKIVLECQQHPDYSQAIQTLLRLAETYGSHGKTVGADGSGTVKEARTGFQAAEADLRLLIERFANGTSTSDLWESIGQIYKDAEEDEELKSFFKQLDSYIRRCLLEQGYILEDESTEEWDRLYEKGRYLLREKYRAHTDRVVDEIKFVADQFDHDAQNKAFAAAMQKLFKDLGNDASGNSTFKPHLVKDLAETILPAVMEGIAYIPIPRIEYSDPQVDAIIENLVLESDNFMPNIAEVASEHYFRWGRKKIANKNKNTIEIKVAGVQMDLRDVSYHVKRKQGFPSLTDTGVADILLPGDGFSFKIKVSTADQKDSEHFLKVDKVDVDVKDLKIKLIKSNHKLLFNLFRGLTLKVIRAPLQKAVEKAIKEQFQTFDAYLYQLKLEADRAAEEAKANPEQAANIFQRYFNAAQKRALQGKEKAEEFVSDKKVNVAITKEDSIFPQIHLPGGISSKATEYKELARKGDKWESPVFSIGKAAKSDDIPAAPKVERKSNVAMNGNGTNGTNGATNGNGVKISNGNGLNGQPLAVN